MHRPPKSEKPFIILLGPPGAGKSTQAELLREKFDFYYLETSRVLEKFIFHSKEEFIEVNGEKFYLEKERENFVKGILLSPPFASYIVKEKLKEVKKLDMGVVVVGSPRTVYECEDLMPFIIDLFGKENIKVVLIDLSSKETIFRNSHRRICSLSRHPIIYSEETKDLTICPLDGSVLLRRKGVDDPEVIKTRLKEYRERTLPLLKCIENLGIKISIVNGDDTPSNVFQSLLSVLNLEE